MINECIDSGLAIVAYATAAPDEVCAWLVGAKDQLHYIYTKQSYRKLGLAQVLLSKLGPFKYHSHETRAWREKLQRHSPSQFNPFLLYR